MRMINKIHFDDLDNQGISDDQEENVVRIKNNFKLISIHIPKTAGTSLYKILGDAYGQNKIARVDYKPPLKKLFLNEKEFKGDEFPKHIEVIHGHINPKMLEKYFVLDDKVKKITFLRDPVERIISDYYYLRQIIDQNYNFDPYNPKILNRMIKSLIEFAGMEKEKNRMSKFLGKGRLNEMFFVGTTENFAQDTQKLAKLLNWNSYKLVEENKTRNKSNDIPPDIFEKIKVLNEKDVELYNKALEIN